MPKQKKTNAARILDEKKIEYTLIEYAVDEEHLDAVHVAREVGLPPEQVFKTLVVRGDLKALAKASGNKRAEMVHLKEVLPLTGYIRGGCSPLGAKKNYPVYLDETCILWDKIAISAGLRDDLVKATGAVVVNIIHS